MRSSSVRANPLILLAFAAALGAAACGDDSGAGGGGGVGGGAGGGAGGGVGGGAGGGGGAVVDDGGGVDGSFEPDGSLADASDVDAGVDAGAIVCPELPTTDELPGAVAGMLAAHNRWRARVGVPPVAWSPTLAAQAQAWVDALVSDGSCTVSYDPSIENVYGQNVLGGMSVVPSSAATVVDAWASTREHYDFGATIELGSGVERYYTQLVWDTTTEIGCGHAVDSFCNSFGWGRIWLCYYAPPGNWIGDAPYPEIQDPCVDLDNDDVLQKDDADDTDRAVQ